MTTGNATWNEQLQDADWVRSSFMLSEASTYEQARQYRVFNTASTSYTTSRLGYNWAINPAPQRTRHADIKFGGDAAAKVRMIAMVNNRKGKIDLSRKEYIDDVNSTGTSTQGAGRWWKEALDDNAQLVHLSFGVPKYRGLVSFFTGFYDHGMGLMANEGRADPIAFTAGKLLGLVVILPYMHLLILGRVMNYVVNGGSPPTSYYSMDRKMHLYWKRADFIANNIAVNMGIVPRVIPNMFDADLSKPTQTSAVDESYGPWFKKFAQDIFRPNGSVDLFKVANRAQRLANERYTQLEQTTGKATSADAARAAMAKYIEDWELPNDTGGTTIDEALAEYFKIPANTVDSTTVKTQQDDIKEKLKVAKDAGGTVAETDVSTSNSASATEPVDIGAALYPTGAKFNESKGVWETIGGWLMDADSVAMLKAENNQGSMFVSFKVEAGGVIGESFSSSFGAPAIKDKVNGMSSASRSARFDFADGKLGIPGVDQAIEAVQNLAGGFLDGVGLSGLVSLAGSAFTDFPDTWQASAADWPSQSFTIKLRPWAGNRMSQYLYMYVPLSLLLAGALPLSTGPQSYTQPFLCEMWSRGRNQVRLGMIDSLDIQRGTGNLGWNNENEALGIDITFSVKDLSTIVHAPVSSFAGTLREVVNPMNTIFPNDSKFNDYLAVLGNLSIADQTQTMRKLSLNATRWTTALDSRYSKSSYYNWYGNSWMGGLAQLVTRDSERIVSY